MVILDEYASHHASLFRDMQGCLSEEKMKIRADFVEGIEGAPQDFIGLLDGKNFGKVAARVAGDHDRA